MKIAIATRAITLATTDPKRKSVCPEIPLCRSGAAADGLGAAVRRDDFIRVLYPLRGFRGIAESPPQEPAVQYHSPHEPPPRKQPVGEAAEEVEMRAAALEAARP